MQLNSPHQIIENFKLWKQFLMLSLFLGLTFFTSSQGTASELFSAQYSLDVITGDDSFLVLNQDHHLSQSPSESNDPDSIPDQREESDEEENLEKEESSDDDRIAVSKHSVFLKQQITEIKSVQYYQSVQNRKTIPFFILFQNWKSFLS